MVFFASRVDPAIGGSYMTLLNTAANLGGTWPNSFVMALLGYMTRSRQEHCDGLTTATATAGSSTYQKFLCNTDPYYQLQAVFSVLGIGWFLYFSPKLKELATLPDKAWRTQLLDDKSNAVDAVDGVSTGTKKLLDVGDVEKGELKWPPKIISNSKQA